jgi:hypothetical protein
MGERAGVDYFVVYYFLGWWSLLLTRSGGAISSMGYLVPQSFTAGGNWVVFRFLGP